MHIYGLLCLKEPWVLTIPPPLLPSSIGIGSIIVLVLNEYRVVSTWFTLKAHTELVASEWMKQITAAQVHN